MAHKKAKRREDSGRRPWLAIGLLGGALVLAIVAVGFGILNADAGGGNTAGARGPQLAVNKERIDFGTLPFDKPVRAEFKLENSGDATLTLDASTPIRVLEGC